MQHEWIVADSISKPNATRSSFVNPSAEKAMEAAHTVSEVVWIKDRNRLVDAESYERTYGSDGGRLMQSGYYYIAKWPPGTGVAHFLHNDLTFLGPFVSRREAEAVLEGMAGRAS